MNKIHIIGVGDDGVEGLTNHARDLIEKADILIGPAYLLPKVSIGPSRRIESGSDLERLSETIDSLASENVVLLAGGDPLPSVPLAFCAVRWVKTASRSSLMSAACNWRSLGSKNRGMMPT